MKKSRKKKSDKIRIIILEGESDRYFFKQLKQTYSKKEWEISLLKAESLNFSKIKRKIKASIDDMEYKEVWLAMDLSGSCSAVPGSRPCMVA